ncbi:MAG: hypothetical protein LBD37_05905 [Treponema sp.]|jgi:hypothetical protein|nr:hypothetical protein [Treponema sp.]
MFTQEYYIVFPEGDVQAIAGRLAVNMLVDINGRELIPPLPTHRMIAFRVSRIRVAESKGGSAAYHYLELMGAEELLPYTGPPARGTA